MEFAVFQFQSYRSNSMKLGTESKILVFDVVLTYIFFSALFFCVAPNFFESYEKMPVKISVLLNKNKYITG